MTLRLEEAPAQTCLVGWRRRYSNDFIGGTWKLDYILLLLAKLPVLSYSDKYVTDYVFVEFSFGQLVKSFFTFTNSQTLTDQQVWW